MPSIYTHNYFAKDLNKELNKLNIYKLSNTRYYEIFAQSFDNLFYYNFLSIKKGKEIRTLGHYAHVHKVWEYFKNMVTYIKKNKLYDDENLGYLYGSLTHYCLDSTAHPYIHYISGRFSRRDYKGTKKYLGYHAVNEIMIDSIYYYKEHNDKYYKYKLYKDLIPKMKFPKNLTKTIDYTFKETFDFSNIGEKFNKSYNQSHDAYKYLMYDRFSIKRKLYRLVDLIPVHKIFKAYSYSHHISIPNYSVLNNEHNIWYHPVTNEKHNESFEDLYNIAYKKCIKMIKKCNDYFNDKCSLKDLEKVIGNISYSSGLDCEIRPYFQYFGR